jgi:RNA-directed DNA polymerase
MKHDRGRSDGPVVPEKHPNKGGGAPRPAEGVEGRGPAKGNPSGQNSHRTQSRERLRSALARVRQVASRDQEVRFTALWHHVYDVDRLREVFHCLKRDASPGIDGQTWKGYEASLESNLVDLASRLRRGAYRAKPVRRVYIPKADGRRRPIGVPALEDKIVQGAAAEVLGAVYEADFLGFSYGFRPGRSQHDALDALWVGLHRRKVNWVLDADIRGFFDAIDHDWLLKFVGHRIADQRVQRHLKKWLQAGVLEDGEWRQAEAGTPQGGSISPLLANVYLHYAFDLWVKRWRRTQAQGDMIVVRYADDFVVGFQYRREAEHFLGDLRARLERFRLELHPEKTRLIEFGRFAASNRRERGQGKPETFDFLGFTHYCGTTRKGGFMVKRRTMRSRIRRKLAELTAQLCRRMHVRVPVVGRWLRRVLRGHYQYYAVPHNYRALLRVRWALTRLWRQVLSRRSQKGRVPWARMTRLAATWLPRPTIQHPWPDQRLRV